MADLNHDWNPLQPGAMSDEDWRKLEENLRKPNYLDRFHFDGKKITLRNHQPEHQHQ